MALSIIVDYVHYVMALQNKNFLKKKRKEKDKSQTASRQVYPSKWP